MSKSEIFCPKCRWKPKPSSRWICAPQIGGCGTTWNTFDTRGVCPQCGWKWIITACLSCKQFSPHEDWYHDPNEDSEEVGEERRDVEDA
jgi:hypothetical protein